MSTRNHEPPADRDALLGTLLAGRYRIEALIGAGGMGAVYRAEHVHMRKAVAVKVLHKEMTAFPEVVARFEREAVAAGRIEHPHVVSASDFGQLEDGSFYLVLEFVEGQSLAKRVQRSGALSGERALRITRQIVEALQAAHSVGIVHRDLKPENVMLLAKDGEPDFVKVLDFGIAKVQLEGATEQPALTQIGTVFGTPEYMAPEQARGELVDARADLYTVGVILFEMLSGVSPFKDDDLVVVLTRHLTADPPPLPAAVDPLIRDLVRLLLRKNRDERVQSAQELLDRIDRIIESSGSAFVEPRDTAARMRIGAPLHADRAASSAERSAGFAPTLTDASARGAFGETMPPAESGRREALLQRPMRLGPLRLPLWLLGACLLASVLGVALLVLLASLVFSGKREASSVKDDASKTSVAKDSELARLLVRAEGGEPSALAELASRPEPKRAAAEWLALGRGYAKQNQLATTLTIYQKGVVAQPELSRDPRLLVDVRHAALDPQTADAALSFAESSLGAPGMDLVYDVWESSKGLPARAVPAKVSRSYLDEERLRARASPALKLLLELAKARKEGCPGVKRWLARASAAGDARVLPTLKQFDDRRGCGFLGLSDCWACLRPSKDLATTATSVSARPAPSFE